MTMKEWAKKLGVSTKPAAPVIKNASYKCVFTAREIAVRALILQAVCAVAAGVGSKPVVAWLKDQGVWKSVSPREKSLFQKPASFDENEMNAFRWRQEAEWTLLWMAKKVDVLGFPDQQCDTRRVVDEIIPELGSDVEPFLASARLRSPGEMLAEDDRLYDLWCNVYQARRKGEALPPNLNTAILFQRSYAFNWLDGIDTWDEVQVDA